MMRFKTVEQFSQTRFKTRASEDSPQQALYTLDVDHGRINNLTGEILLL